MAPPTCHRPPAMAPKGAQKNRPNYDHFFPELARLLIHKFRLMPNICLTFEGTWTGSDDSEWLNRETKDYK